MTQLYVIEIKKNHRGEFEHNVNSLELKKGRTKK